MHALVSCKNEEDPIKNEGARVFTTFLPLSVYVSMRNFSDAQGQLTLQCPIWLNFELRPDFIVVLVTCKNEECSIKNEGARLFATLYIDFSDAQGQLTR